MSDIHITFLATSNQIDMMEKSVSRYEDVKLISYNLANQTMADVILDFDKSKKPDILVITLPSVSGIEEFKEYVKSMDFQG